MTNFKTLDVWTHSMTLVTEVYKTTVNYPKEELYGLISQTRRAAVSIPSNIAEGVGRNYKKDTIQFLYISRASLYELDTLLNIAVMINIIDKTIINKIEVLIDKCLQLINGLIRYYRSADLR